VRSAPEFSGGSFDFFATVESDRSRGTEVERRPKRTRPLSKQRGVEVTTVRRPTQSMTANLDVLITGPLSFLGSTFDFGMPRIYA
jgi:hypothetical protein